MQSIDQLVALLGTLHADPTAEEQELHATIAETLEREGIVFTHEARLAQGARIDFLTREGIGIEVKKNRPAAKALRMQIARYLECPQVYAIVVVTHRGVELPRIIGGKPCRVVCLNRAWGVAL